MRLTRTKAVVVGLMLAATTTACGGDAGSEDSGKKVEADKDAAASLPADSHMKELADKGEVTIGVKFDQPGLGFKDAASDVPTGFDVEIAKILAAGLGIDPATDKVKWVETISDNREPFLQKGRVDLVLATYSITDERKQIVGQTGPYMVTGQQVLVKEDNNDIKGIEDLKGKEVCSAEGSTSLENVNKKGAKGVAAETYSACAEDVMAGTVPAMSTDGSILLGLAAQNEGELKVVGDEFSEERIGVGYPKDYPEMCEWINETLQKSFDNGDWAEAFESTLGKSGAETPEPPKLDPCES
jgi:glutamate transport system substrate-binding protein